VSPDLVSLIAAALQELTAQEDAQVPAHLGSETSLFGHNGLLDSLGLVTLVVTVEQAIEDTYGISVSLADERAMSQRHSPYRTIGSLAEYAGRMIQAERRDG
jgi:D-alanine--poly(phosphoribitol) ligase subunit 2